MALPEDRVPTLVQYCQRVAAVNVDAISSLGDGFRYDLVKPILERCTVEQLLRLEQASPYLQKDTPEIWRELCFRTYPMAAERYRRGQMPEPASWRDQYFVLVEEETRRIEEVGNKIRRQRQEADERKKEQEIKITMQMPPAKRRWGAPTPPKSLFQKTRSEASRLQKNMYTKPMIPPMPSGKSYPVLSSANSALLPVSPSGKASSRVTVTTVKHRVSGSSPASASKTSGLNTDSLSPVAPSSLTQKDNSVSLTSTSKLSHSPSSASLSSASTPTSDKTAESPLKKPRRITPDFSPGVPPSKRDPMASLFLPKHRAHSQRVK
ncbi:RNA polymerase II transcription factor SIII subunit A-domain-containing protein [Mycena pura]|uniref:RNA polymerase II transcription factor SIII subunit A-domain-containing protein n=1 Tax=Mycena pura TaxID=153505 RepID=A0AAD6VQ67_9AGAR|nr:RNA polymerase II transcription factor SIII subunit A-domain-containing protein [Mycena pura]